MPNFLCLLMSGVLLALAPGCVVERTITIVEKHVTPKSFKFVTVVEKTGRGAGGWRAACLRLTLKHDPGDDSYVCNVGVEVPMKTREEGTIHLLRAKRVAAACANEAADLAFTPTTPATPLGIACSSFIATYGVVLGKAILGTRVTTQCRPETQSVVP